MSDIKPLDLPSAAGVEFGRGDVRHFSEDDAVDVPGLQNPTRHLAQRDNLLADKVNEIVGVVNNKEQFVPLVTPKTTVPPGTEEIVTNFKIPEGFEARVLNAAIGSSPASSALALKVYYATGYGNLTGTELVSTSSIFSSGAAFYNDGEFIVTIRNSGSATIEASASVTVTIRPIGSQSSLLVGSVIRGPRGYSGGKGDPGGRGDPGVGGAGTPGLVWKGAYDLTKNTAYNPGDAVSFVVGTITNSYVCKKANPVPSVDPPDGTYWDVLASGSAGTGTGLSWEGTWVSMTPYSVNDLVTHLVGGSNNVYICTVAVTSSTSPDADGAHWDLAVSGGGETPVYASANVNGSATPTTPYVHLDASFVSGAADGDYLDFGGGVPKNVGLTGVFTETKISNTTGTPKSLLVLHGHIRAVFKGLITVYLPQTSDSTSSINWTTSTTHCVVTIDTQDAEGSPPVNIAKVTAATSTSYSILVDTTNARKVSVTMIGVAAA